MCYNARQDNTIQYSTVQCNTVQLHTSYIITYNTQGNSLYTKLPKKKKIKNTIETQKRVEPEVDESVLKTSRYTKQ